MRFHLTQVCKPSEVKNIKPLLTNVNPFHWMIWTPQNEVWTCASQTSKCIYETFIVSCTSVPSFCKVVSGSNCEMDCEFLFKIHFRTIVTNYPISLLVSVAIVKPRHDGPRLPACNTFHVDSWVALLLEYKSDIAKTNLQWRRPNWCLKYIDLHV